MPANYFSEMENRASIIELDTHRNQREYWDQQKHTKERQYNVKKAF